MADEIAKLKLIISNRQILGLIINGEQPDARGGRAGEADTLHKVGLTCIAAGKWRGALECFEAALPIFKEIKDRKGEAYARGSIGVAHEHLGEWQQAMECFKAALEIFQEIKDRQGEARARGSIGGAHEHLGEWQQAMDCHAIALKIFQEIEDRHGEAITLYNIGVVYDDLGEWQQAVDCYTKALPIYQEIKKDRKGEADTLINIGIAYRNLGEWQQALDSCKQARPIYQEIKDRKDEAKTLLLIDIIEALKAKSLDKSRPGGLLSPGDTATEQGMEPMPKKVTREVRRAKRENTVRAAPKRDWRKYKRPDRIGGKQISFTLKEDLVMAFGAVAKANGTTMKAMLENFIIEAAKEILPLNKRRELFEHEVSRTAKKFGLPNKRPAP